MDDFLLRALAAGVGVALISGPLGCFVVWRRMAYFGATLAHSALLGVALALLLDMAPNLAVIVVSVAVSLLLVALQHQRLPLAADTLLGILAHAALALGLVVLAFLETVRVDLMSYLFGDILSVTTTDLAWIYGGGALSAALLAWLWNNLLAITVHEELARVEGINVGAARTALMLLIGVVIAVAMKIVGVLLIVSLLIIPAAAARPFSRSPETMAVLAAIAGALAVAGGLGASLRWDTPAGPSIVVVAAAIFTVSMALRGIVRKIAHRPAG